MAHRIPVATSSRAIKTRPKAIGLQHKSFPVLQTIHEEKSFHMLITKHRRHQAFDDTVFEALVLDRISVPPPPGLSNPQ